MKARCRNIFKMLFQHIHIIQKVLKFYIYMFQVLRVSCKYFTIFSLITNLSTDVRKSLQCKGIFFMWRHLTSCLMKIVNYLDVTLNLNDGSYSPYKKPNDETKYVHINSDHPPIHFKTTSNVNRKTVIIFIII